MCEHRSKRIQEKVKVSEEEIPCAYAATQTTFSGIQPQECCLAHSRDGRR